MKMSDNCTILPLNTYEKIFLRDIYYASEKANIFLFHEKYLFSHLQLYTLMEKFKGNLIIHKEYINDMQLSISIEWKKGSDSSLIESFKRYLFNNGHIECDMYPNLLDDWRRYIELNKNKNRFVQILKYTKPYKDTLNLRLRTTIHCMGNIKKNAFLKINY